MKLSFVIKQNAHVRSMTVGIFMHEQTTELYNELEKKGLIKKLKETQQLGVIRTVKNCRKSRYDYVILQIYLHQIVKTHLKGKLQQAYNSKVKSSEYLDDLLPEDETYTATVGELVQILSIICSLGHYYNTFTASRAEIEFANENSEYRNMLKSVSANQQYREYVDKVIDGFDYHRIHLLHAYTALERYDQDSPSVQISKALLLSYLQEDKLSENSKLRYVFKLYRAVRDIAYVSFDLQVANTSFSIDLRNEKALGKILQERLSMYNDRQPMQQLMSSLKKLLDDTIYNEESNTICYQMITNRIIKRLHTIQCWDSVAFYDDLWSNTASAYNRTYSQIRDFYAENILKLTFSQTDRKSALELFDSLNRMEGVRSGYYSRVNGDLTVLASIKKKYSKPKAAALKILRSAIKCLRGIDGITPNDARFLLCTKFFLFYLFNRFPINIVATVSKETCVLCTKGKSRRLTELDRILREKHGDNSQRHEVEFLRSVLAMDIKNDVCITVPSSIQLFDKDESGNKFCEFDGMIIFPNRTDRQIVFLEAKDRKDRQSLAVKCLTDKFQKLNIQFDRDSIVSQDKDAFMHFSV